MSLEKEMLERLSIENECRGVDVILNSRLFDLPKGTDITPDLVKEMRLDILKEKGIDKETYERVMERDLEM